MPPFSHSLSRSDRKVVDPTENPSQSQQCLFNSSLYLTLQSFLSMSSRCQAPGQSMWKLRAAREIKGYRFFLWLVEELQHRYARHSAKSFMWTILFEPHSNTMRHAYSSHLTRKEAQENSLPKVI